jgi:hypothetical protein
MRGENKMSKSEIWAALEKKNAAKAVVHFSGGNDEGGVGNIFLLDVNGKKIEELQEEYVSSEYNAKTGQYEEKEKKTENGLLADALSAPVYSKYGSFAGEFYVSGTITYDVKERKIKNSGREEVSHNEEFDKEL